MRSFRHILRHELRAALLPLLGWTLPLAFFTGAVVSMFPKMAERGSLLEEKLRMMPRGMVAVFGFAGVNLTDPAGYLSTTLPMLALIGAIYATHLGATILSKEEAFGTVDLLLAQPLGRAAVVLAKATAGLLLVLILDTCVGAVAFAAFAALGVTLPSPVTVAALFAAQAMLHTCLFALALAASVRLRRPRAATGLALLLVLLLYGAGAVSSLSEPLGWLRWLSPFRYAEPVLVVAAGGIPGRAWTLPAAVLVAVAAAVVLYRSKDIHA